MSDTKEKLQKDVEAGLDLFAATLESNPHYVSNRDATHKFLSVALTYRPDEAAEGIIDGFEHYLEFVANASPNSVDPLNDFGDAIAAETDKRLRKGALTLAVELLLFATSSPTYKAVTRLFGLDFEVRPPFVANNDSSYRTIDPASPVRRNTSFNPALGAPYVPGSLKALGEGGLLAYVLKLAEENEQVKAPGSESGIPVDAQAKPERAANRFTDSPAKANPTETAKATRKNTIGDCGDPNCPICS